MERFTIQHQQRRPERSLYQKQFYHHIKGLPEKLNKMTFAEYGLSKWSTFKSNLKKIKLDKSITSKNVKELFKTIKKEDFMRFTDYNGRKIQLSKKTFKKHTVGKYVTEQEIRHQLFPHLKEVLNNPDEVWYNNPDKLQNKFQSRYVKFYQNMILNVDCEFKPGMGLNIKSGASQNVVLKKMPIFGKPNAILS